ncbi:hypothetical protein [Paracoccus laeviglucosivorans]|uniref:hypothetical protein n=1 Tax=Paracoccus laeviglucosivorans TaxID=1197861 RepID=UPI001FEB65CF|nr:hypothetical protein [Paracoccus laeviglucosivorans]
MAIRVRDAHCQRDVGCTGRINDRLRHQLIDRIVRRVNDAARLIVRDVPAEASTAQGREIGADCLKA